VHQQSGTIQQFKAAPCLTFGEDVHQFIADPFGGHAAHPLCAAADGVEGGGLNFKLEAGGETHGAQHAQVIFLKPLLRVADGADAALFDVAAAFHEVEHLAGSWVHQQGVYGEIATPHIAPDIVFKLDAVGMSAVSVGSIAAEGGHLHLRMIGVPHHHDTEMGSHEVGLGKQVKHLFGTRVRGDVVVFGLSAHHHVAHTTAHQESLETVRTQFEGDVPGKVSCGGVHTASVDGMYGMLKRKAGARLRMPCLGCRFVVFVVAAATCVLGMPSPVRAQAEPTDIPPRMETVIQSPAVAAHRLREYIQARIPELRVPANAAAWTEEARRLRAHQLDAIFRGWPKSWVDAPLRTEDRGFLPPGNGFKRRKLRLEIVPGFWIPATLYEPAEVKGKLPAVLNVTGHEGPRGRSAEYEQKRRIHQARNGILALALEWPGMGELSQKENAHALTGHLDLVGANAVGFFYLAMRKGLDYLWEHPHVDRARIGMTGLSGGGWQTIILSSLDERIAVAAPVAGYMSLRARIQPLAEAGDLEQSGTDLLMRADYPHMTAMRAPKPTLLIYNNQDDCCFRAPTVKPTLFDLVRPFFRLYQREDVFLWHENLDPSTHNYQHDNRGQSFRFFAKHFGLNQAQAEEPPGLDVDILSLDEMRVGVPEDNLTILGLARKLAADAQGNQDEAANTAALAETVRYRATRVKQAWTVWNAKNKGLESREIVFDFDNGLSATGVWFKAMRARDDAPVTVVMHDGGKKAANFAIAERVNRGEVVVALDPLLVGDSAPQKGPATQPISAFTQFLGAVGERPMGLQAAQVIAVARWASDASSRKRVRVEPSGIRTQTMTAIAAALEPGLFHSVHVRNGAPSLGVLLEQAASYWDLPDMFCLGMYPRFDLPRLENMAAAGAVSYSRAVR
jgi:dienelactone hydrolase